MMQKFYSNSLKKVIQQISKPRARKFFDEGRTIYFQSSNMGFDNPWQSAMEAMKNGFSFQGYTFDQICNSYECFNCDNARGKYIHFFVEC